MNPHFEQEEMRSGDSLRSFFFQSPYLKQTVFSPARRFLTFNSQEKEPTGPGSFVEVNKENVSPISGAMTFMGLATN